MYSVGFSDKFIYYIFFEIPFLLICGYKYYIYNFILIKYIII